MVIRKTRKHLTAITPGGTFKDCVMIQGPLGRGKGRCESSKVTVTTPFETAMSLVY